MFCPASHRHVMEANATDLSKEIGITIVEVYAAPPAQGIDLGPRPMATALRDRAPDTPRRQAAVQLLIGLGYTWRDGAWRPPGKETLRYGDGSYSRANIPD